MSEHCWEDSFDCDGHCGAMLAVRVSGSDTSWETMKSALVHLGWLFLSDQEAYCPNCQRTASRIHKAREKKS